MKSYQNWTKIIKKKNSYEEKKLMANFMEDLSKFTLS